MFMCLLLLFYTVESLYKERGRRMHEILGSAPVRTGAILFGKALGNSVMAAFILVVAVLVNAGIIVRQQIAQGSPAGFELWPFVAVWGGVLLPTFIFWTALITALFALFRNRYVVYGTGMAVFIYTLRSSIGERFKSWVVNWLGLDVLNWSDMGTFAPHGYPLLLNRLLYLSLVPLLIVLSVRWFGRRDFDATGLAGRLSPRPLLRDAVRVFPLAVPAIVLASMLVVGGRSGYQGPAAEEWEKEYWSRNVATWDGFRMPSVSHVDLDLDIEPGERSVAVDGAYTFRNHRDYAYERFPLTAGPWEPIEWTLGGEPYDPENRDGLYLFTPGEPLASGDTVTVGFRYRVAVLGGISRTPEPVGKFVLESGVNIDGGPWVMWMLQQEMGREHLLSGLRAFIEEYKEGPDYPVIQDMLAVLRDFAPDTAAFDAFAEQWFFSSVLPEYRLSDVTKVREGDEWVVRGTVENAGTGRMRVQVGAAAGERWSDEGEDADRSVVAEGYRDVRTEVVLGAGESAGFVVRAGFEPERMVIDPDLMVLQRNRGAAVFELSFG